MQMRSLARLQPVNRMPTRGRAEWCMALSQQSTVSYVIACLSERCNGVGRYPIRGRETQRRLRWAWDLTRPADFIRSDQERQVAFDWDHPWDGGDQVGSVESRAARGSYCDEPVNQAAHHSSTIVNQGRLVPVPCGPVNSFIHPSRLLRRATVMAQGQADTKPCIRCDRGGHSDDCPPSQHLQTKYSSTVSRSAGGGRSYCSRAPSRLLSLQIRSGEVAVPPRPPRKVQAYHIPRSTSSCKWRGRPRLRLLSWSPCFATSYTCPLERILTSLARRSGQPLLPSIGPAWKQGVPPPNISCFASLGKPSTSDLMYKIFW